MIKWLVLILIGVGTVTVLTIYNEDFTKNPLNMFKDEVQNQIRDETIHQSIDAGEVLANQACDNNPQACGPTRTVLVTLYILPVILVIAPLVAIFRSKTP